MSKLQGKIDFTLFISVKNANPNGDPLNGNRPRTDIDGYGEISDVCIKRKIRNRMQDLGERIFVQSDERSDDGFKSLKERADGCEVLKKEIVKKKKADRDLCAKIACEEWTDVRSFGQVFAFKGEEASFGVRGPVSIHQAVSLSPVNVISMQIVKSVNSEAGKESKASDTMGTKHRVGFENDASSARPEGSLEVCKMYWWQHKDKTPLVSTGCIQRSFHIDKVERPKAFKEYNIKWEQQPNCVEPEIFDFV